MCKLRTLRDAGHWMLVLRWMALAGVIYLSAFHWMRAGYWEYSGVWQYGLPLLDPRFAAALIWTLISSAFWILVGWPTARWLARQIPAERNGRRIACGVLACGLGTRGVVGPLLLRAVLGSPLELLAGNGELVRSGLTDPYLARWAVVLAEAAWMIPFLAALWWALERARLDTPRTRTAVKMLLAGAAVLASIDAPYLLTAGGPHGATQNLQLLLVQEGFGRQEFGYAAVLTVLLSLPALLLSRAWLVVWRERPTATPERGAPNPRVWPVLGLGGASLLLAAWLRLPPELELPPRVWLSTGWTLAFSALAGVWANRVGRQVAGYLDAAASDRLASWLVAPMFFPLPVLVLPFIRLWGYCSGPAEGVFLAFALVLLAPFLLWSVSATLLLRFLSLDRPRTKNLPVVLVAWATWTELGVPVLAGQSDHLFQPLQGQMLWALSTHLWTSPLSVPGWPIAWLGGTLLAWIALDGWFEAGAHKVPEPTRLAA